MIVYHLAFRETTKHLTVFVRRSDPGKVTHDPTTVTIYHFRANVEAQNADRTFFFSI